MKGLELLNNPFLNKGSAFTKEEREKFNLNGLLPTKVRTIEEQAKQTYDEFTRKQTNLEKRLFLMGIFSRNRTLFYKLLSDHLVEFMPIIYDPVVAESIEKYNEIFSRPQDAAFLSIDEPNDIEKQLKNVTEGRDIQLIVVTDAEGILGIGDWGVNGVDIVIGKLMVYTAAAGIDPKKVLPVSLDVGTNNENLLNDDLYLGNRHRRITGERYDAFIDKFVKAVQRLYPDALLHWEDFGRDNATKILKKYEPEMATFNDDVQGTGIVV
uniref:oxaloacetate-decarboxylating malate dehydrogenase n=2 Tax=Bacilli TaxID=91061 RepID=UPI003703EC44